MRGEISRTTKSLNSDFARLQFSQLVFDFAQNLYFLVFFPQKQLDLD